MAKIPIDDIARIVREAMEAIGGKATKSAKVVPATTKTLPLSTKLPTAPKTGSADQLARTAAKAARTAASSADSAAVAAKSTADAVERRAISSAQKSVASEKAKVETASAVLTGNEKKSAASSALTRDADANAARIDRFESPTFRTARAEDAADKRIRELEGKGERVSPAKQEAIFADELDKAEELYGGLATSGQKGLKTRIDDLNELREHGSAERSLMKRGPDGKAAIVDPEVRAATRTRSRRGEGQLEDKGLVRYVDQSKQGTTRSGAESMTAFVKRQGQKERAVMALEMRVREAPDAVKKQITALKAGDDSQFPVQAYYTNDKYAKAVSDILDKNAGKKSKAFVDSRPEQGPNLPVSTPKPTEAEQTSAAVDALLKTRTNAGGSFLTADKNLDRAVKINQKKLDELNRARAAGGESFAELRKQEKVLDRQIAEFARLRKLDAADIKTNTKESMAALEARTETTRTSIKAEKTAREARQTEINKKKTAPDPYVAPKAETAKAKTARLAKERRVEAARVLKRREENTAGMKVKKVTKLEPGARGTDQPTRRELAQEARQLERSLGKRRAAAGTTPAPSDRVAGMAEEPVGPTVLRRPPKKMGGGRNSAETLRKIKSLRELYLKNSPRSARDKVAREARWKKFLAANLK